LSSRPNRISRSRPLTNAAHKAAAKATPFAPELVLVSAGFDAHAADPLAQLEVETEDFIWLTERLKAVAARHAGGRLVSVLEGGYDLDVLAESAATHVQALMRA